MQVSFSSSLTLLIPTSQILIRTRATDLDSRMYDGSTALILAARLAVEGMVEELITCHADVNAVDELGKCVLLVTQLITLRTAAVLWLHSSLRTLMCKFSACLLL